MTHGEIWGGICNLASELNLSRSGLARAAGLDPTALNQSKTFNKYGQHHWPTMQTLAKILDAAGISLSEFATLLPSDTHENPKCSWLPEYHASR